MSAGDLGAEDDVLDQLEEKAEFCLSTGIQPSEYDAFTDDEREVFVKTWNRIVRKRNSG